MEKEVIAYLSAWLGPIVAISTVYMHFSQRHVAKIKRKDDLFDKRYEFYKRIERGWLETYYDSNPTLDEVDLIPVAIEASFLFGKDIVDHIIGLADRRCSTPLFVEDEFIKPFNKYLKLESNWKFLND